MQARLSLLGGGDRFLRRRRVFFHRHPSRALSVDAAAAHGTRRARPRRVARRVCDLKMQKALRRRSLSPLPLPPAAAYCHRRHHLTMAIRKLRLFMGGVCWRALSTSADPVQAAVLRARARERCTRFSRGASNRRASGRPRARTRAQVDDHVLRSALSLRVSLARSSPRPFIKKTRARAHFMLTRYEQSRSLLLHARASTSASAREQSVVSVARWRRLWRRHFYAC